MRFYNSAGQSGLEALAQGAERGIGLGLRMKQMKRQAEQDAEEKRRYEEEKVRATDLYNRQVANDVFQKNVTGRQQDRLDQQDQRYQANTQSARDIGAMAVLSDAPEGQMGPHDPEHEQALGIARNLSPEALPLFLKEHEQIQRTKMLGQLKDKHLSQWQDMTRNPALGQLQGAGHVEEIMARAQMAQEAISGAQTPEQLQEALKTSKEGLEKTTVSIGQALDKQNQMLRVVQHYRAGPHGITEQQAAVSAMPAGIREFAQKIVDDQDRLVSAYEAGAITSGQLTTLMEQARNQKPGGSGRDQKPTEPAWKQARDMAVEDFDKGLLGDPMMMDAGQRDKLVRQRKAEYQQQLEGGTSAQPTEQLDTSTPEGKRAALKAYLEHLGINPDAPAPKADEPKKGGGKLLRSTGDKQLDDFYASSPR